MLVFPLRSALVRGRGNRGGGYPTAGVHWDGLRADGALVSGVVPLHGAEAGWVGRRNGVGDGSDLRGTHLRA